MADEHGLREGQVSLRQMALSETKLERRLDSTLWAGSFNSRESTIQQLAPYVGRMKSGMARVLIDHYCREGDTVFDPFCGSGVVPFEAALMGRVALGNDLSPYGYVLTRGKLSAPRSLKVALEQTLEVLEVIEGEAPSVKLDTVPKWVREFFHPQTLRETIAAFQVLFESENYFLLSCLLGILHHVRPGFLSYPASHLVPYLRRKKYPPADFPEMYEYRDLRSRLLAKVRRAYRRTLLPEWWGGHIYKVTMENAMKLSLSSESVDAIVSSPPYFGALDYARDNRLRLWFLGVSDWKELDKSLTASDQVYLPQMRKCLSEMHRVLKRGGYCVLVLGDVARNGKEKNTARILSNLAVDVTNGGFEEEELYSDVIPDNRRSRRRTRTTKIERILVMRKF